MDPTVTSCPRVVTFRCVPARGNVDPGAAPPPVADPSSPTRTLAPPEAPAPPDAPGTARTPEPSPAAEGRSSASPSRLRTVAHVALRHTGRVAADVAPALLAYAVVRFAGLVALLLMGAARGLDAAGVLSRLTRWDAGWLLSIAENGYDTSLTVGPDGLLAKTSPAFFPFQPGLVHVTSALGGLSIPAAGFVVTAVAGLVAAAGLDRVGRLLAGGRWGGIALVVLWACWPHSVVLTMPYSEAPFVAFAAWGVYAAVRERWAAAGMLTLLAGATRPTGTVLAAAVSVSALVAMARGRTWRPLVAVLLSPLGFLGYWAWLSTRTGRWDAWFVVQRQGWGSSFDWGAYELEAVASALTRPSSLVLTTAALVVVASVVLLVALLVQGAPLPVLLYAVLGTFLSIGSAGYPHSRPRFLLCVFPLVIPLARALAAGPRRGTVALLGGALLFSAWESAYLLLLWPSSP
jgi:hypothetical protein